MWQYFVVQHGADGAIKYSSLRETTSNQIKSQLQANHTTNEPIYVVHSSQQNFQYEIKCDRKPPQSQADQEGPYSLIRTSVVID